MKNHLEYGIFRSRMFNLIGLFSFNIYYYINIYSMVAFSRKSSFATVAIIL